MRFILVRMYGAIDSDCLVVITDDYFQFGDLARALLGHGVKY